jgi:hypothetical protein
LAAAVRAVLAQAVAAAQVAIYILQIKLLLLVSLKQFLLEPVA